MFLVDYVAWLGTEAIGLAKLGKWLGVSGLVKLNPTVFNFQSKFCWIKSETSSVNSSTVILSMLCNLAVLEDVGQEATECSDFLETLDWMDKPSELAFPQNLALLTLLGDLQAWTWPEVASAKVLDELQVVDELDDTVSFTVDSLDTLELQPESSSIFKFSLIKLTRSSSLAWFWQFCLLSLFLDDLEEDLDDLQDTKGW